MFKRIYPIRPRKRVSDSPAACEIDSLTYLQIVSMIRPSFFDDKDTSFSLPTRYFSPTDSLVGTFLFWTLIGIHDERVF